MTWQEPIAAIIVGLAVVSLYRHLRNLVGAATPEAKASCHGCDNCDGDLATPSPPSPISPIR